MIFPGRVALFQGVPGLADLPGLLLLDDECWAYQRVHCITARPLVLADAVLVQAPGVLGQPGLLPQVRAMDQECKCFACGHVWLIHHCNFPNDRMAPGLPFAHGTIHQSYSDARRNERNACIRAPQTIPHRLSESRQDARHWWRVLHGHWHAQPKREEIRVNWPQDHQRRAAWRRYPLGPYRQHTIF